MTCVLYCSRCNIAVNIFPDPCKNVFCQSSRVCRSNVDGKGECVCANASHCHHQHARKKICGSDGHFYNSHCELHRTACLKNVRVSFDRSGVRCRGNCIGLFYQILIFFLYVHRTHLKPHIAMRTVAKIISCN